MAVTTGTPWDIVLNDAATTAVPTSPRAAYQAALHRRAVLVDVRPASSRARDGELPALLRVRSVDPVDLDSLLDEIAGPVLVIDDDGSYAARRASHGYLVAVVTGGFIGWLDAGLPVGMAVSAARRVV